MSLVIKDNDKGKRLLAGLLKPSRRASIEKDLPNGFEIIEKLEKRFGALEKRIKGLETQLNNVTAKVITIENRK